MHRQWSGGAAVTAFAQPVGGGTALTTCTVADAQDGTYAVACTPTLGGPGLWYLSVLVTAAPQATAQDWDLGYTAMEQLVAGARAFA